MKALKDLHSRRKLVAIGVEVKRQPYGGQWINTNRLGLPSNLPALSRLLTGGVWQKRIALTITSKVEVMRTNPNTDITTITDSSKGDRNEIALWSQWVQDYSRTHWKPKLDTTPATQGLHVSMSRGPNTGESVMARMYDILAFAPRGVWPLFIRACKAFGRQDLLDLSLTVLGRNAQLCKVKTIQKFIERKNPQHVAT